MAPDSDDAYFGRSLDLYGEFRHGDSLHVERIVRTGDVVIEVGANNAARTVRLAKLAGPEGCAEAFDPQRLVLQTLCANLARNSVKNTHCDLQGAGSETGELPNSPIDYDRVSNFGWISIGTDAHRTPSGKQQAENIFSL